MSKIITAINIIKLLKNWPLFFLDYFKLVKEHYIVYKLRNGIEYQVRANTDDVCILSEVWAHNYYTPPHFEINERDVVLDIGAQIGIFSILASKKAKDGTVYSFEPVAENFELLKRNIDLNSTKNIVPVNKAVSEKIGKKNIYLSPNNTGGHSFFSSTINKNNKIVVQTISLDEFIKKNDIPRIDLLKIDCEGAEYEILFGCSDKILKIIKKICMEYHDIDDLRNGAQLKNFLEKYGFKVTIKSDNCSMLYALR